MSDEIELKLKNKKFKDLKTSQKALFITCCIVMIATLIYTGFNLDGLSVRYDTLHNRDTMCDITFKNGVFDSIDCPNKEDIDMFNISGTLTNRFTLEEYYDNKYTSPFKNMKLE